MKTLSRFGRPAAGVVLALVAVLSFSGCSSTGGATKDSPALVRMIDAELAVTKDREGNMTKGTPVDPTGGAVPIVSTALSVLAAAWFAIRRISNAHDSAIDALGKSTPATMDVKERQVE